MKFIYTNLPALICFFIAGYLPSISQPSQEPDSIELKPRYGAFFRYNYNMHTANFTSLPGIPSCCPTFTGGTGTGISIGALYEMPMDFDWGLGLRLGFSSHNGLMKENESTNVIIDGKSQPGIFQHKLDFKIASLAFEPEYIRKLLPGFDLHAGLRLGLLLNTYYEQEERIVQPADRGTFPDGTRIHNQTSGDLPQAAVFQAAISVGLSYDLPMNKKNSMFLSPEIYYQFWFTPVVPGVSWSVHSIQAGLSIKYRQPLPPPPPPPPPLPPPMPDLEFVQKPPMITASVRAVEIDSNNSVKSAFTLKIEDFISLNMRPLLNYVFFDENSSDIPDRYKRLTDSETEKFSTARLQNLDAMQTYYQMLNIIGKRLRDNPAAGITLTGTNSGSGPEKDNLELSKQRAEKVRDYLVDTWKIDPKRIKTGFRNLPKKPSSSDEPGVESENRRVEIESDDSHIEEPVMTIDTLRMVSKATIRFLPKADADAGIKDWDITGIQDNSILFQFSGAGSPPPAVDWPLHENGHSRLKSNSNIYYVLTVSDSIGQQAKSPKASLPVEQLTIDRKRLERIEDKEFEYYSLILFDYGKAKLEKAHKDVVNLVRNRLSPGAKVVVYGYTDQIGEEAVNKRLSEARAREVAKLLAIPGVEYSGIGESELLFTNDLPEGRFYCRTVRIEIITPVKE